MNIPNQIPFLDIVINYIFGLLCVLAGVLYIWNFTTLNILEFGVNLQWVGVLLFIFLPYLIGLILSGSLFAFMLRISVFSAKLPLNKIQMFLGSILFGIKQKPDGRTTFIGDSDLDNIIKKRIKKTFNLDVDKLSDTTKRELFYIIMRYLDNFAKGDINRLERLYLLTNILSSTTLFLLLLLAINTIALFYSLVYDLGIMSSTALISVELTTIIMIRFMANRFQSNLLFWWKNVWRSFIIVEGQIPIQERNKAIKQNRA